MSSKLDVKSLKELRELRGYTQEKLARMVGYSSQAAYCGLELGHHKTTVDKVAKLAEALEVTPGTIVDLLMKNNKSTRRSN